MKQLSNTGTTQTIPKSKGEEEAETPPAMTKSLPGSV